LEYDAEFGEMDRAAQAKAEQQFGDTVVAAEPADWKAVKKLAESLMERTKDMRVAVYWARASLHQVGLTGFEQALRLLRGYVETFWDSVHPELDHEDDDDPTYRTNTLVMLCDEETMLRDLRESPLVSSRTVGRFSLKDWEHAREAHDVPAAEPTDDTWSDGSASAEPEEKGPSIEIIEAAFQDVDIEAIEATEQATRLSAEHLAAIDQFVTEKVGAAMAVSLAPAKKLLEEMNGVVAAQLQRRGGGQAVDAGSGENAVNEVDSEDQPLAAVVASATGPAAVGFTSNGKICSRDQAMTALDEVCEYYELHEPSSPLPILIRRARRLASMNFLDILRDVAPDAVAQAEVLSGVRNSDDDGDSSEESEDSSSW
jgi:type VI secretion system protein ImpA